MQYRELGTTGVRVSTLCLGAMMFGSMGNRDHDDSVAVIRAALDAGVNLIDTADIYSYGESEEVVAKAIAGRRDEVLLATKCGMPMDGDRNHRGSSRHWVIRACEASLRRLGVEHIDLYQVHRHAPTTDIDDTLGALSDLVHQGKVRYLGASSTPPAAIVEAQWAAERRHRERFVCEQPPYSALVRGIEAEVLPVVQKYRMGAICYSPLSGGWLSGRWRAGREAPSSARAGMLPHRYDLSLPVNQAKLDAASALADIAEEAGMTLIHLALGFVLAHPAVTAAIIGPRTREHLDSQLAAGDVELSSDLLDRIDAVVAPGTNIDPVDRGYVPAPLTRPHLRRRAPGGRS